MTTGAPNIAVIELILISVGANTVLAIRSQNIQNAAPPRKHAGIMIIGFAVLNILLIRCGTAIPTNDIGPANAVTTADNMLDNRISRIRNLFMFTPIFFA